MGTFVKIENFAYGEINERGFSNPYHRQRQLQEAGSYQVFTLNV